MLACEQTPNWGISRVKKKLSSVWADFSFLHFRTCSQATQKRSEKSGSAGVLCDNVQHFKNVDRVGLPPDLSLSPRLCSPK